MYVISNTQLFQFHKLISEVQVEDTCYSSSYNICLHIFIFSFFGFVLTPLILMALIYVYIFRVVKEQAKVIASLQVCNSTFSILDKKRLIEL